VEKGQRQKMRNHPDYIPVKNIIRYKVFPILRKLGFVARMNFSCCASCASYELAQVAKERNKTKIVFYHMQADESFKRSGKVCLYYFSMLDNESRKREVGIEISNIARQCGLNVTWDGNENTAIVVCKNAKNNS
jgi:hypothetical protein